MYSFYVLLVLWVLILPSAPALAEQTGGSQSPYFVVLNQDAAPGALPLRDTRVAAVINGVLATVSVTQEYANTGQTPLNLRYVFPASTRAAVQSMTMTVGERVVAARIQKREEARQEFDQARAQGKSASLLEEERPNVFTMNLANVMPGDTVRIELVYSEILVPEEGTYSFVYPTVVGPRYAGQGGGAAQATWITSPYLPEKTPYPGSFAVKVELSAGMPVQEAGSATHELDIKWQDQTLLTAALAKPEDFGGNRDFIFHYRLAGKQVESGLLLYEGPEENFFLLMTEPPTRPAMTEILPREYIFVVDVSGSMYGFPLDTAKTLMHDLIGGLRETDCFNLVLFSGAARVLAPASLPATGANTERALAFLDAERGGGGTELPEALRSALALPRDPDRARTLVVVTDGFIGAEKEACEVVTAQLGQSNVFTFGIGSSVNRHLVESLARAGQGEPFVVTRADEAADAAARFRQYVQAPLLSGVRITAEGFDMYDLEPQAVADLFAGRPLVVSGKWRGRPEGRIHVSGKAVAGPYEKVLEVGDFRPQARHESLARLWAGGRVARLLDRDTPEDKEAITQLGLRYGLLTPYTSFVAVLEEVRNRGEARDVEQPLPLPQGVSNLAVGGGYRSVPEPGLTALLAGLLPGLLAARLVRRRRNG